MILIVLLVFVVGYLAIAFENEIHVNKAASALVTGVLCWLLYFLHKVPVNDAAGQLFQQLGEISAILFFLLGAMTIVEVVDSHHGFDVITNAIKTNSKSRLLILVTLITFFLSAILDNLTTAIVMISLCSKLLEDKQDRLWFVSMVIMAANAGGAWSPLGDVTTSMLWIGGQITAINIILKTFFPSLVVVLIPLIMLIAKFKNQQITGSSKDKIIRSREGDIILFTGLGLLVFVPAFKAVTHMPPFMGMLLALGIIWVVSSLIHLDKHPDERYKYSVSKALQKIDTSSILFFLGILLSVAALQSFGILNKIAAFAIKNIDSHYVIGGILGLFSAILDNVPLVAAAQGMFSLNMFPTDHVFWEFLSLSAGTGGSTIIIGSAAGVAAMGIEKIGFFWYLKNISWIAFLGFLGGLFTYILQQWLLS